MGKNAKKYLIPVIGFLMLCFAGPYLIGLLFPFLLGYALAAISDRPVRLLGRKLPRWLASFLGVTLTLTLGCGLLSVLGAVLVKELGRIARAAPDIRGTFGQGVQLLQDFLISLSNRAPEGIRPMMVHWVLRLFSSGSELLDRAAGQISKVLGAFLGKIPDRAFSLGTGILAGFLISARLPEIKTGFGKILPEKWKNSYLPLLEKARQALKSWFLAQGKLALVTFGIVAAGFMLLRIPYGPLIALVVALVDAVPLLGTGTVLLPWALIKLLQKDTVTALGLLAIYGTAVGTRTVLEPRLVGRHLGLDPLVTLFFLYLGYRFWGLWGMIFFPMIAGAVKSITA